ncbi:transcription termination/antitermination protein NusG [Capsicum galapagoense]
MKQAILTWSHSPTFLPKLPPTSIFLKPQNTILRIYATVENVGLTAKERRQLRNERRESKTGYNWREEVEERLIKKPKKEYKSWTEELNLDNLAKLGTQWWVVRVSRVNGHETAERMARALSRNFPDIDFQVYIPSVQVKRKLKNGTLSVKPKPLFPGCVFLKCVLNKEIHDFIRECAGIGGFVGSKVGNTKRQINKPRPVDEDDLEAIFKQAKEEQERADQAFEEEEQGEGGLDSSRAPTDDKVVPKKRGRQSKKASDLLTVDALRGSDDKSLIPGSTIEVVSGAFAGFSGILKKVDSKAGLATVGFSLFGKETLADIDVKEIVAEVG